MISEALQKLNQEGAELGEQGVAALSPYVRQHINRFGRYQPACSDRAPTPTHTENTNPKLRQDRVSLAATE
ncbi:Tn3 family transposase [Ktedonobacter robiniae]|uniref:Tn3 transposase DDE domain-containing protein n=1 Tax=Ktedonobacter robiniae TaxID=2778365 RepID=A0ABQ3V7R0_9CHLR|nr:hypothetical protein KSB_93990 [Ktedonobacter robiniae]